MEVHIKAKGGAGGDKRLFIPDERDGGPLFGNKAAKQANRMHRHTRRHVRTQTEQSQSQSQKKSIKGLCSSGKKETKLRWKTFWLGEDLASTHRRKLLKNKRTQCCSPMTKPGKRQPLRPVQATVFVSLGQPEITSQGPRCQTYIVGPKKMQKRTQSGPESVKL